MCRAARNASTKNKPVSLEGNQRDYTAARWTRGADGAFFNRLVGFDVATIVATGEFDHSQHEFS